MVELKIGNGKLSEGQIIEQQKALRVQLGYNLKSLALDIGEIISLNRDVEVVMNESHIPPTGTPKLPPPHKYTNLRGELMDLRSPLDGKPVIHACIRVLSGPARGMTRVVTNLNDIDKVSIIEKMQNNFTMWMRGYLLEVRGYDESTVQKLLNGGCEINKALLSHHGQFDKYNWTVVNKFSNHNDQYYDDMLAEYDLPEELRINKHSKKSSGPRNIQVEMGEEAREELLKNLNIPVDGTAVGGTINDAASRREGFDGKSAGDSTNNNDGPARRATDMESMALENAKLKAAAADSEAAMRQTLLRMKQMESLLAAQGFAPPSSGSSAAGDAPPPPDTEAGGSAAGQP